MAAVVERAQRRHVSGGSAAGCARRGRNVPALAAPAAPHASRPDLPVGRGRARFNRLRDLDENGHAVYRQLVVGSGLADYSSNYSARFDGQGSELIGMPKM